MLGNEILVVRGNDLEQVTMDANGWCCNQGYRILSFHVQELKGKVFYHIALVKGGSIE